MARVEIDYREVERGLRFIGTQSPRLKRAVGKSLRTSADRVKSKQSDAVGRGGTLSATIANSLTTTVRYSGRSVGVTIRASGARMPEKNMRRLPRYVDRGSWRHPVYGNQNAWVVQKSWRPGWFSDTATSERGGVEREMESTIKSWVAQVAAGI